MIEPLTALDAAGVNVTVATPSGDPPQIDERSVDPDSVGEDQAERIREIHETDDRLNDPAPITQVDAADYDAVVFPGSHGRSRRQSRLVMPKISDFEHTAWDVNQDVHARALLRDAVEGDEGTALVVCHAAGILAFARSSEAPRASENASGDQPRAASDGEMLVEGRDVTGFPNEWEERIVDEYDRLPDGRKLPYWVEDEVVAAGGNWDAGLDADSSVTVDDDLITARGPESSTEAAQRLIDELGIEMRA